MPVVESRFEGFEFPPCCCGCGSRSFKWRTHTDSVIVRKLLALHGNDESGHRFFRKGCMIAARVVALPFAPLLLSGPARHHG